MPFKEVAKLLDRIERLKKWKGKAPTKTMELENVRP